MVTNQYQSKPDYSKYQSKPNDKNISKPNQSTGGTLEPVKKISAGGGGSSRRVEPTGQQYQSTPVSSSPVPGASPKPITTAQPIRTNLQSIPGQSTGGPLSNLASRELLIKSTASTRQIQQPAPQQIDRGTRTDLAPVQEKTEVQTQPYLTREIISTTTDTVTGKVIPVYGEVKYIDPTVQGKQFERPATAEEVRQYEESTNVVRASSEPFKPYVARALGELSSDIKQSVIRINQEGSNTLKDYGLTDENIRSLAVIGSKYTPLVFAPQVIQDIQVGISTGIIKDIRDKPFTNVAVVGAGVALGAATRTIATGIAALPKLSSEVKALTTVGALTVGGGLAIREAGKFSVDIATATPQAIGERVGVAGLRFAELGVGTTAGIRSFDIVQDYIRVIGRKEIATELVVAPEYFAGQRYPAGFRGQTAGQLKAEFYSKVLPTEETIIPKGFTASPAPFTGDVIKAGTSEVPGLFSAPRISPTFFRVEGESTVPKLIDIKTFLDVSKPTALRVSFNDIEYAPGVTSRTPLGTGRGSGPMIGGKALTTFKPEFKQILNTGRTLLPAAKTEKEVITAAESRLIEQNKQFFVEFEGRKIPINEYKVVSGVSQVDTKLPTIKQVVSSSYGSIRREGMFNPLSAVSSYSRSTTSSFAPIQSSLSSAVSSSLTASSYSPSSASSSISSLSSVPRSSSTSRSTSSISSIYPSSSSIRAISRSIIPSVSSSSSSIISQPSSKKKRPFINFNLKPKESDDVLTGYKTIVKIKGKEVLLPGIRERGAALRYGEDEALKTLRATFKVIKTQNLIRGTESQYTPDKAFRSYKISKGKKINLQDTFIQRRGFRLSSRGERAEIQSARRKK